MAAIGKKASHMTYPYGKASAVLDWASQADQGSKVRLEILASINGAYQSTIGAAESAKKISPKRIRSPSQKSGLRAIIFIAPVFIAISQAS